MSTSAHVSLIDRIPPWVFLVALIAAAAGMPWLLSEGIDRGDHIQTASASAVAASIQQLDQPATPAQAVTRQAFLTWVWHPLLRHDPKVEAPAGRGGHLTLDLSTVPVCEGVLGYFRAHPDQAERAQLQINGRPARQADALAMYRCLESGRGNWINASEAVIGPVQPQAISAQPR